MFQRAPSRDSALPSSATDPSAPLPTNVRDAYSRHEVIQSRFFLAASGAQQSRTMFLSLPSSQAVRLRLQAANCLAHKIQQIRRRSRRRTSEVPLGSFCLRNNLL